MKHTLQQEIIMELVEDKHTPYMKEGWSTWKFVVCDAEYEVILSDEEVKTYLWPKDKEAREKQGYG